MSYPRDFYNTVFCFLCQASTETISAVSSVFDKTGWNEDPTAVHRRSE